MKVKAPKCTLTEAEKGYIAGFIDGEGHLEIRKHPRSYEGKRYWTHSIRTAIANTDQRPLDFIQNLVGGKRYIKRPHVMNHETQYHLCLSGKETQALLGQILPYLIIKKEIACLMLEYPLDGTKQGKDYFDKRETLYLRYKMISPNHSAKASKYAQSLAQTKREDSEN